MKKETKRKVQTAGMLLFILYLVLLTYFLFFSESFGRTYEQRRYSYNLKPFKEIARFWNSRESLGFAAAFINIAGNILCFVPFGAILPVLNRPARKFPVILFLSFEFSLLVECTQLILRVGSFDVDDLILNTLGGLLGYLAFAACDRIRRKKYG